MKSIIVYGDIHGCFDEFVSLREKISPAKEDIEVSVGDFLNKGPFSLETMHYILQHDILSVMGNNEAKLIKLYKRWQEEGTAYLNTLLPHEQETLSAISKNEIAYLKLLPYYLKFANLTILHGGIRNSTTLNDALDKTTKKELTLLRYFSKTGEMLPWHDVENRDKFWSEVYDGGEGFVVFGHNPFPEPKIDRYALGIDTGCVYGGQLTAAKFIIDEDGTVDTDNYALISVEAQKDYWNS